MKIIKNKNKKGITLIIVTSVMLVLSTTAVTFVRLAGYERTAATNFADTVNAKLAAYAGIDHAIGLLHENMRKKGHLALNEEINGVTLQYPIDSNSDVFKASQENEEISLRLNVDLYKDGNADPFAISGFVGRRLEDDLTSDVIIGSAELHGNFYSLKIEDNAAKFNVNSHVTFSKVLTVGDAVDRDLQTTSNLIFSRIINSLASICFGNDTIANRVSEFLSETIQPDEKGIRFSSDKELEDSLRELAGFDGAGADKFIKNVTTQSFIDPQTSGVIINSGELMNLNQAPSYYTEARSPININIASEELLTAIIENVKGRGTFYVNKIELGDDDTFENFRTEKKLKNLVAAFQIEFSRENAISIAENIIEARNLAFFQDNGDIDNFFLTKMKLKLPTPVLDDAHNRSSVKLLTGISGANKVISEEVWLRAVQDTLRSNFNPNIADNFWNPNAAAYRRVCKGELVETIIDTDISMTASHTTELTTFSVNSVNITSIGRVTAQKGLLVTGSASISTIANFGNRITHTTQKQFESEDTPLAQTVTSPENITLQQIRGRFNPDTRAGAVEPAPIIDLPSGIAVTDVNVLFFSGKTFASNKFDETKGDAYIVPPQWETPIGTNSARANDVKKIKYPAEASPKLPEIMRAKNSVRDSKNNIAYDGLVSRKAFYSTLDGIKNERYFIETAFENIFSSDPNNTVDKYLQDRNNPQPDLRSNNIVADSNIANRSGSLQFWVKFDADTFDSAKPFKDALVVKDVENTTFGLIGVTTASGFRNGKAFPDQDTNFREGTQMYVYMNALGELRVSRLYYALCFKLDSAPYGAMFESDVDSTNRQTARRDVVFQTNQKFKAHEWYHLRILWDDAKQRQASIDLFVNNEKLTNASNGLASIEVVDDPSLTGEYCLLNEEEPLDSFYINGFLRSQAVPGGYFHFDKDIHFAGNATIDNVISSTDKFFGQKVGTRKRYSEESEYSNNILASEIDEIIAAIRWTSYPSYRGDEITADSTPSNPNNGNQTLAGVRLSKIIINNEDGEIQQKNIFVGDDGKPREIFIAKVFFDLLKKDTVLNEKNIEYSFEFLSPLPLEISDGKNADEIDADGKKVTTFFQGASCATLDSVTIITLRKYPQLLDTVVE